MVILRKTFDDFVVPGTNGLAADAARLAAGLVPLLVRDGAALTSVTTAKVGLSEDAGMTGMLGGAKAAIMGLEMAGIADTTGLRIGANETASAKFGVAVMGCESMGVAGATISEAWVSSGKADVAVSLAGWTSISDI